MRSSDGLDAWVLLGPHKGDNDQVLALAHSLGIRFRLIQMRYGRFAHLQAVLRSVSIAQLLPEARREIAPPWPRLVLGIGQRSVPVARYIRRASGGLTKIVRLGDPMVSPRHFDLVITTEQYAIPDAANVVRLPLAVTSREEMQPEAHELQWLESYARPLRLIVLGGKTSLWRFGPDVVTAAARTLLRIAKREGGSVIAVTSPRSSSELVAAARAALGSEAVVTGPFPPYRVLLGAADEIHVTGDSVSMLSDAVATGKPVGLIPLEPTMAAKALNWAERVRGRRFQIRQLDRFWDILRRRGLVGTLEQPRFGRLDSQPIDTAVAAIHALLEECPAERPLALSPRRAFDRQTAAQPG